MPEFEINKNLFCKQAEWQCQYMLFLKRKEEETIALDHHSETFLLSNIVCYRGQKTDKLIKIAILISEHLKQTPIKLDEKLLKQDVELII